MAQRGQTGIIWRTQAIIIAVHLNQNTKKKRKFIQLISTQR